MKKKREKALLCFCGRVFDTTQENSPGPDMVRIDRLKALSWICGAVPVLSWWSEVVWLFPLTTEILAC